MPSIIATTETFVLDRLHGTPQPSGDTLGTINRVGVDGVALRLQAAKPGFAVWESKTAVTTTAKVKTTLEAYKALQGQIVEIIDEFGNSWTNVAVVRVAQTQAKAIGKSTGFAVADPVAIVQCTWQFQFTQLTQVTP
ncbi:MAG: hypothetical protein JKX85_11935 [Phycisphaeraceae bacterium]|nr:hypothetical protein [Phycisphaeraceae bacterium]